MNHFHGFLHFFSFEFNGGRHVGTLVQQRFGKLILKLCGKNALIVSPNADLDLALKSVFFGAVFSSDRAQLDRVTARFRHSAGNFYLNDKPTGTVVGRQPFGGGSAGGTDDKAGSSLNLIRWVSPRTIKETIAPARAVAYPFMAEP